MIESGRDLADGAELGAALVVVGAGPGGIVTALGAARRGVEVILIESGARHQQPEYQDLSKIHRENPDHHAPLELATSREIGGTSSMWGGRCVPYDPIDFADRAISSEAPWPIGYSDVEPYHQAACEWSVCGRAVFDAHELTHLPADMVPGLVDGDVRTSDLERWSLPTNFGDVYFDELASLPNLRVVTEATVTQVHTDGSRATSVTCKTLDGTRFAVTGQDIVLAAGGLGTTRLLMCSPTAEGTPIGDHSGHLGRWYMAHLEGTIAELVLTTPPKQTIYNHERDIDGSYVRRRFSFTEGYQLEHRLPNIVGWISNPEFPDASHGSAALSLVYLMLISPIGKLFAPPAQRMALTGIRLPGTPYGQSERSPIWQHLRNVLLHPWETVKFAFNFGVKRTFARKKPPGFFIYNRHNRYPFQYHGEHLPHRDSRVQLASDVDELGMPRLDVDIRFTDEDIAGIIAAHRHWDAYLRKAGVGRLDFVFEDLSAAILDRSGGGFHQVGTTRMSERPEDGVVDRNLTVHGFDNLHIVSSSAFPTSSQANSTFLIVVVALRLLDHLLGPAEGAA